MAKKVTKIKPTYWLILALVIFGLLLTRTLYRTYDWVLAEDRDYALMDELDRVGMALQKYKEENGSYPQSITSVRGSDQYCVYTFNIKKCASILYKPSPDLQDFKMAADATPLSGAWPILFYSPRFSVSRDVMNSPGSEEYRSKSQDGTVCWFCAAYRSVELKQSIGPDDAHPVYKQDTKYFPNPDEWPDIVSVSRSNTIF